MMKQNRALEVWVGLFVGLGIAALVVLAFYVGNLSSYNSNSGYLLEARFDEIGGLKPRAPVTISGVQVGRVTAIHLDNQEYRAVVRMEIDPEKMPLQRLNEQGEQLFDEQGNVQLCDKNGVPPACSTILFEDAAASILTAGMLGEQYVGLEPGGGALAFLYPGDEVRMTQSSIALEQVIGQFLFNQTDKDQ
ncbi:MAG: outer membrane lipid asymmetry maintenance protein MlaD [Gammaproteobacteria bacterium]|jgi:phospholipid/cholesterol/gamma-HCH transport system substrate-binding protein|nr:outer membrane lipid asymmetry maintenance protein MlaD [Gammaproteobacteria bacterium]MBT3489405.1 outer membrane lipid asymmetry maintenance protein MlaD [Gammaproteobacteria bacterium]MBT3718334.1 outer membrane lipid asymmetry maintenance protein MlaD [Gammaproteobacteria bacterium]MBT3844067.1 outer membrane lipid asymmetry maintenance protein MlaD [Gammaproteobacteria bacterium]MBT3892211.1 outer membrane lipid asymmetry maintenance protein MlaD [Gammaproteobacteria bacterium]